MGRATSEKVGRGLCPQIGCGEPVVYRKSAGGMLTYKCENCDSSGYAEPGGDAYKARMTSIIDSAKPRATFVDPANPPAPTPTPAKRTGFNMADL